MGSIIIRSETTEEIPISSNILRQAFGRDIEYHMVQTFRTSAEFNPNLSIVADDDGEILGYALYCKAIVETTPGAYLATMAVLPGKQKQGVGERLVRHGLERCRGLGLHLVFVHGLPNYFSQFGFSPALAAGFHPENPAAPPDLQVIDLTGSIIGKVQGTLKIPAALLSPAP